MSEQYGEAELFGLVDVILDELVGCAFATSDDRAVVGEVTAEVLNVIHSHERSGELVEVLAYGIASLLEEAEEDDEAPPQALAVLAEVAGRIADQIDDPAILPIYVARFGVLETEAERLADVARASALYRALTTGPVVSLGASVGAMAVEVGELGVARSVAERGLAFADEADPDEIPDRQLLHEIVALGMTDNLASAAYLERLLTSETELACVALYEIWFDTALRELIRLGEADADGHELIPALNMLAEHPDWWRTDPDCRWATAVFLAKGYLAAMRPVECRRWLTEGRARQSTDPQIRAEQAVLAVELAQVTGQSDAMERLLAESAGPVREAGTAEHSVRWLQLAEALLGAQGDSRSADQAHEQLVALIEQVRRSGSDVPGLGSPPELLYLQGLHRRAMVIQRRCASGASVPGDVAELKTIVDAIREPRSALRASVNVMLALLAFAHGQRDVGRSAEEAARREFAELNEQPVGGFSSAGVEFQLALLAPIADVWQGRVRTALAAFERIRDNEASSGGALQAAIVSTVLAVCHRQLGNTAAAFEEGVQALAFYTRRSTSVTDARERAAIRARIEAVVSICAGAALDAGRPEAFAELLEVVRAQPTPLARPVVPDSELSLSALLAALVPQPTESPDVEMLLPWAAAAPARPAVVDESGPDSSASILVGLPSIRMPWGVALADRLSDPSVPLRVSVRIPRGPLAV